MFACTGNEVLGGTGGHSGRTGGESGSAGGGNGKAGSGGTSTGSDAEVDANLTCTYADGGMIDASAFSGVCPSAGCPSGTHSFGGFPENCSDQNGEIACDDGIR